MILKPVLAVVTAAALLAGGSLAVSVADLLGPAEDDALELVPADAAVYTNVFLNPSASQKLALDDLLTHFPGAADREAARERLVELIDEALAEVGLAFDADVEPWLGDQIAFFAQVPANFTTEPGAAVLIETEDIDAALVAVDKVQAADAAHTFRPARHEGFDYEIDQNGDAIGAIDSFLVAGTETGLRAAIDASQGRSLAGSDRFESALGGLAEDRLALAYLDPAAFARLALALPGAGFPPGAGFGQGAFAFVLYARGDGIVIEGSAELPEDPALAGAIEGAARESKMLERLPGDAWFALGTPDLGPSISALLRGIERGFAQGAGGAFPGLTPGGLLGGFQATLGLDIEADLLAWMGDAAFFASGTDPERVGGGAVIEATDPAQARAAIKRLGQVAERLDAPLRRSTWAKVGDGFALQASDMPDPFNVIAADDRVLAIYGDGATGLALGSDPSLAGTEGFTTARASLGDGFALGGYVNLRELFDLVRNVNEMNASYGEEIEMWLDPLDFVSFGTKVEDGRTVQRIVLGVR